MTNLWTLKSNYTSRVFQTKQISVRFNKKKFDFFLLVLFQYQAGVVISIAFSYTSSHQVIHSTGDESKATEYDTRTWIENAKSYEILSMALHSIFRETDVSIDNWNHQKLFFRGRKRKKNFHVNTFDVKFYLFGFVGVFVWNIFIIWLIVSVWSMWWNVSGFAFLWKCFKRQRKSPEGRTSKRTEKENHFRSVKLIFLGQVFWGDLNKFILVPCFV